MVCMIHVRFSRILTLCRKQNAGQLSKILWCRGQLYQYVLESSHLGKFN